MCPPVTIDDSGLPPVTIGDSGLPPVTIGDSGLCWCVLSAKHYYFPIFVDSADFLLNVPFFFSEEEKPERWC